MNTFEWDENKRAENIRKHGIDFHDVFAFDLSHCKVLQDTRTDYAEDRFIAYGYAFDRLMVLVFTLRGDSIRVISYRKANSRERMQHGKTH